MRQQPLIILMLLVATTAIYAQAPPQNDGGGARGGAAKGGPAQGNPIVSPDDPRIPQPSPVPPRIPRRRNPNDPRVPAPDPTDPQGERRRDPEGRVPNRRVPLPEDPNNPQNGQQTEPTDPQGDDSLLDDGFALTGGYGTSFYEDPARGQADLVRSWGMKNLLDSKATKTYEEARRDYIENRLRATQAYFENRRYNDDYRNAKRSSPLTMEEYVRLARIQAPDRLSVSQLDPFTGRINWPSVLLRPEYDNLRSRIDTQFQARATGTVLVYSEIAQLCKELLDLLMADMETFTQNEYIQAKNFVQSLGYESQLVQR